MIDFIKRQVFELEKSGRGDKLIDLVENMHQEKYTIGTIGVTHRVLTNWEDKGVLLNPKSSKDEKWRKFDLSSVVWLKMVKDLRELNAPLDLINKMKEQVSYKYDFVNDQESRNFLYSFFESISDEPITETEFSEVAKAMSLTILDSLIIEAAGMQSQVSLMINK